MSNCWQQINATAADGLVGQGPVGGSLVAKLKANLGGPGGRTRKGCTSVVPGVPARREAEEVATWLCKQEGDGSVYCGQIA